MNHNRSSARSARDGNLSSIVSQIRDDGPAEPFTPKTPRVAAVEERPASGTRPPEQVVPLLLREAEPVRERPNHAPHSITQRTHPGQPKKQGRSTNGHGLRLILALLIAALMSGGVVLLLYPSALEGLWPRPEPVVDGVHEEIAALKASIAVLSERLDGIDKTPAFARTSSADSFPLGPLDGGEASSQREPKTDSPRWAADQLTERIAALTVQLERLVAKGAVASEDPSAKSMPRPPIDASTAQPPNLAADRSDASDAVAGTHVVAGRGAASSSASDSEGSAARAGPEREAPLVGGAVASESRFDAIVPREAAGSESVSAIHRRDRIEVVPARPSDRSGPAERSTEVGSPAETRGFAPPALAQRSSPPDVASGRIAPVQPRPGTESGASLSLAMRGAGTPEEVASGGQLQPPVRASEPEAASLADRAVREMRETQSNADMQAGGPGPQPRADEQIARRTSAGRWFVNLIAVRQESTAQELRKSYFETGVETEVVPIGGGTLFGVRVTGLASRADAVARASAVKERLGLAEVWIGQR